MSVKQYLDAAGVERLVRNINLQLSRKVSFPDQEAALSNYATTGDLAEVSAKIAGVYHFRGTVATRAALANIQNPAEGDVYNITEDGMNVAWTGTEWDDFGSIADLSNYLQTEDVEAIPQDELTRILYGGEVAVVENAAGIKAMVANDKPEVEVILDDDLALSSAIVVPAGKKVTFDLGGKELTGTGVLISCDGGDVVLKNGAVESNGRPVAVFDGTLTLDNAEVTSVNDVAISATGAGSKVIMNGGKVTAQESGVLVTTGAKLELNDGEIKCFDNCPIQGNGTAGQGDVEIVMNGGKLIAGIQTSGYTACGVYMPNTGKFTMNGGEIISDGAGLVMRAGEVELNGGSIVANGAPGFTGKVGDSRVVVGPYAVVYDEIAKYPGATAGTFKLTVGRNMQLSGTDGDISTLLSDGASANIIDNR